MIRCFARTAQAITMGTRHVPSAAGAGRRQGQEGLVLVRTFKRSVMLSVPPRILVVLQQHLLQWMLP